MIWRISYKKSKRFYIENRRTTGRYRWTPQSSGKQCSLDWWIPTQRRHAAPRRWSRLQRGGSKVGLEAVNGDSVVAATHVQRGKLCWPVENKIGTAVRRRKARRLAAAAHVHIRRRWELARDCTSCFSVCQSVQRLSALVNWENCFHRRGDSVGWRRQLARKDKGRAKGQLRWWNAAVAPWCTAHAQQHPGEMREPIAGGGARF